MLICADAVRIPLADESVHMIAFSPPYWGLREYAGCPPTVWADDVDCEHEWQLAKSPSRNNRNFVGRGGRRSNNPDISRPAAFCARCGTWCGCLGLEPTVAMYIDHLMLVMAECRRVLRNDGSCWVNIGDTRTKTREWAGVPHRFMFTAQENGWRWEDEIIWHKPDPMVEPHANRTTRCHELLFVLNKSKKCFYNAEAIREKGVWPAGTRGGKGSQTRCMETKVNARPPEYAVYSGTRKAHSVWRLSTSKYKGAHYATYPEAFVERMIRAGSAGRNCPHCGAPWAGFHPTCSCAGNDGSGEGIVLDPFAGSGTTVAVAAKLGRRGIGLDLSMKYLRGQAKKRVRVASAQKVGAWAR